MTLTDNLLDRVEATVDDEYQRAVLHKGSTVSLYYGAYLSVFLGAALAWLVPADRAYVPLLAIVPPVVGSIIGTAWVKRRVPRPRLARPGPLEVAVAIVATGIWLAGIQFNRPDGDLQTALGLVTGAIVGGVIAFFAIRVFTREARERDEERLDAEFGDD